MADEPDAGPDPVDQLLDILVYALMLSFVVASVGYLGGVLLLDLGVSAVKGALLIVIVWELWRIEPARRIGAVRDLAIAACAMAIAYAPVAYQYVRVAGR